MAMIFMLIANVVLLFLFGLYNNIEKYVGSLEGARGYLLTEYRNASFLSFKTYNQVPPFSVVLQKEKSSFKLIADDVNRGLLIYQNDGFFNLAALMYVIFYIISCMLVVVLPCQCYAVLKSSVNCFTNRKHKRSKTRFSVILANIDDRGLKVRIRKRSTVSERNKRSKWLVDKRRRKRMIVRMWRAVGEEAFWADVEDYGKESGNERIIY